MKRKKGKRKRQQRCRVEKALDAIQKGAETAIKVYRVIKPLVNAFTNRPRIK